MEEIAEALDCLDKTPKSRKWRWTAGGFLFAAIGAAPGAVLMFDSHTDFDTWVKAVYLGALGLLSLLALICWLAGRDMDDERVESMASVKARVARITDSYQQGS